MDLFNLLKERGYFYQVTNEENVRKLCNDKNVTVYMGIDPTANSLHIGHFFSLMMLKYFQKYGHRVIVVVGGATARIGDPSGKSDLRKMLTNEEVDNNVKEVMAIVEKFISTKGENAGLILNNAEWLKDYAYIDFMREIGVHFNVNKMLSCDAYANRIKSGGLTFLEMGYMLMQAYDFVYLNKNYGCSLEIGGSDQWANIVAGMELGRKLAFENGEEKLIYEGLTCPLLTNSEGKKMGKTEKGALWVNKDKTSVYDFYQYFYNVQDKDVENLLRLFTEISLEDIKILLNEDIRKAKQVMAYEITKLVHGEEEAKGVLELSTKIFAEKNLDDAPSYKLNNANISLIDLLFDSKLVGSKSEARRLIIQGGISVNDEKITDFTKVLSDADFNNGVLVIKKGKKIYQKIELV